MTKRDFPFDKDPLSRLLGDREPLEVAREVFVYAPIGLATRLSKDFPDLVQEGKQRFSMAKVVGTFAANQGKRQVEDRIRDAADAIFGKQKSASDADSKPAEPAKSAPSTPSDTAHLPIPRYDTLSASQVLSHLSRLTVEQRNEIAAYERTTRNRRTILNRIEHLNSQQ